MPDEPRIVPIDWLLGAAPPDMARDPRDELSDAEVIVAVDWTTQQEVLVFGRQTLQQIVDSGSTEARHVMRVGIERNSDDLEKLRDLVKTVKGRCE